MCLVAQNMEFDIPSNGSEKISNCIMCSLVFLPKSIMKKMYFLSNLWPNHICIKKDHGLWDGGGPIWCIVLRRKCQRSS
jgi:hypothetical protein